MKRKVSLKLSSAAKGPGLAGLSQKRKGHHLEDCKSITRMNMDDRADHRHRTSSLQPWRLDSVYCNCSCSSCQLSLCLSLFAITQGICHIIRGLEGLRGSRLYRNDEMQTCNCTKPINARGCQGMNRTSLHTANQCTAQLNYVFLFSFSLWSYFPFHATNDWFIKCYISVDVTITDI